MMISHRPRPRGTKPGKESRRRGVPADASDLWKVRRVSHQWDRVDVSVGFHVHDPSPLLSLFLSLQRPLPPWYSFFHSRLPVSRSPSYLELPSSWSRHQVFPVYSLYQADDRRGERVSPGRHRPCILASRRSCGGRTIITDLISHRTSFDLATKANRDVSATASCPV